MLRPRIGQCHQHCSDPASSPGGAGVTGGTIEYRLQYSDVGSEVSISPVKGARPIEEFAAALQRELTR
jgi:hypothetical protein